MGVLRKAWSGISHAFTLQSLLLLLFPTGIVVGLALWLSTLTAIVRLFAPLSYLLVALLAIILALAVAVALVSVAKQLGWKPNRRPTRAKLPTRDAPLPDVAMYVARQSAWGIANVVGNTPMQIIHNELMDRICEEELTVWGRIGQMAIDRISTHDLQISQMHAGNGTITRGGEWGVTVFTDVQLNWKQVRRTWPKPSRWDRLLTALNVGPAKKT
jgi:hypothetical protein